MDNITTGYVLSLVGGMERILCDLDGGGNVTAWYVHGPDLCDKVNATNGLTCYHADAMANIIALTDGNTNLVAQYAYTPYGRSLGSTITNLQSFTFVGSQGVMEELPGLYFMRARYYSADAGVFLSTDQVKKIGPGWKPSAYGYVDENPQTQIDPNGENPWIAAFMLSWWNGSVSGVAEKAAIQLTVDSGIANQQDKDLAEIAFKLKSFAETTRKSVFENAVPECARPGRSKMNPSSALAKSTPAAVRTLLRPGTGPRAKTNF